MTTLRQRRRLVLLAVAATGVATLPGAALSSRTAAADSGHLDVAYVAADAAAIEIRAQSAYSFVVNPDAAVPRASASIGADRSLAVAGPADPGDDLDALPGTALPLVTGSVTGQLAGGASQAPPPLGTVLAQGAQAAGTVVAAVNPVTQVAGMPVEHVTAAYPDGQAKGTHAASFGTDPQVADPTGSVAADSALGRATAGPGLALADAGAGTTTTATPLGIRIGRLSSHAETHVSEGLATSDAVAEVDSVDVTAAALGISLPTPPALPGLPAPPAPPVLLHVDAIRNSVHTERSASGGGATWRGSVVLTGVTVLGQPATLDGSGLHVQNVAQAYQPALDALNRALTTAASANALVPGGTPAGAHPVVPAGHVAGPLTTAQPSHGGDETTVSAAGLTLTVAGTMLAPASTAVPPPPGPPQLTPVPVTLTLALAATRSSAYGRSLPTEPLGGVGLDTTAAGGGNPGTALTDAGGASVAGGGADAGASAGPSAAPAAAATPPRPRLIPAVATGAPLPRPLAVTVAMLAELLLLGALVASYRRALPLPGRVHRDPEALP